MGDYFAFLFRTIVNSFSMAFSLFTVVEGICAIIAAVLLFFPRVLKGNPWRDWIMMGALLISLATFVITALSVSPYLEYKAVVDKLGPDAYKADIPYISVDDFKFQDVDSDKAKVQFTIENTGNTPAPKLSYEVMAYLSSTMLSAVQDVTLAPPMSKGTLSSHKKWTAYAALDTSNKDQRAAILDGKKLLYVFGRVSYEDVFTGGPKHDYVQHFCWYYHPDLKVFILATFGNDLK